MTRSAIACLVGLACLVTALNAVKPIALDDTVYYYYVRQTAAHPLDPYGFILLGATPANESLAPPVSLYWWAIAYRLFGEQPLLWKLWLLPFPLIFAFSLHALCRRFARGLELPLVALALLGPALLPCFNLMPDLPALALSLLSVAVFLRACDRESWAVAAAAGLVAGLAMQTKYTGFTAPAVMLAYAVCFRRIRFGLLAAGLAAPVFVGWECFTAVSYGESHFLHALRSREQPIEYKLRLALPLITLLGGAASAAVVLGLAALGARRRTVLAAAAGLVGGVALIALTPERTALLLGGRPGEGKLTLDNVVFGLYGLALLGVLAAAAWRLCRLRRPGAWRLRHWRRWRVEAFLVLWVGLEIVGYFALTPFPAVRRVIGPAVAALLLLGRLASRTCRSGPRIRLVWAAAAVSALLGLWGYGADFLLWRAEKVAVEKAIRLIRQLDPGTAVWFASPPGGAMGYYGCREGVKQLGADGPAPQPGDWVLVVLRRAGGDVEYVRAPSWKTAATVRMGLPFPVRSRVQTGGTAFDRYEGPIVEVEVCRQAE